MAKKIFASKCSLCKGKRWYIDYCLYDPATDTESRHRQDFDLNDIENLEVREAVAVRLIKYLDLLAQPKKGTAIRAENTETVKTALATALAAKMTSPRENTHRGYKSISKSFLAWATRLHYADLPITDFARKHARAYFDWLKGSKPYRGVTLNNYRIHLGGLWTEMVEREMIEKNPWTCIKPFREEEKLRRPFTEQERITVAREIEKTDYWLFRGVLLQFYCYVRPVELTRLKMKDFDLGRGLVTVTEGNAKKWKRCVKTIPKAVLPYFVDGKFDKYPANYYMYGLHEEKPGCAYIEPGTVQIGDDRMYQRHLKVLQRLQDRGDLGDIAGLHWYSWKDTGISMHVDNTSPLATQDQAGHSSFTQTDIYRHAKKVNPEYRALENDLF